MRKEIIVEDQVTEIRSTVIGIRKGRKRFISRKSPDWRPSPEKVAEILAESDRRLAVRIEEERKNCPAWGRALELARCDVLD